MLASFSRLTRAYEVVAADIVDLGEALNSEFGSNINRYYYTTDEQGSTTLITDGHCNIRNEYYYDPSGYAGKVHGSKASAFGEMSKEDAKRYNAYWKRVSENTPNNRPVFKVSRQQYPNHMQMLENAQKEGHSLENLIRNEGTRAANKNRYNKQKEMRKSVGAPPTEYDYDLAMEDEIGLQLNPNIEYWK